MLPNLVVIGGMKCGTSSLHYYLSLHPQISMSEPKELSFFAENWPRGRDWYEAHFPEDLPIRGESSPNYMKHPAFPGVPERMVSLVPDAKLVYLVRDPIARIVRTTSTRTRGGESGGRWTRHSPCSTATTT